MIINPQDVELPIRISKNLASRWIGDVLVELFLICDIRSLSELTRLNYFYLMGRKHGEIPHLLLETHSLEGALAHYNSDELWKEKT